MKIQSLLISTLAIAVLHAQEKPADPYRKTNEVSPDSSCPAEPVVRMKKLFSEELQPPI